MDKISGCDMNKWLRLSVWVLLIFLTLSMLIGCARDNTDSDVIIESVVHDEETESVPPETEVPVETDITTENETSDDTVFPEAGINPLLKRDGTPKKYFTMSFDDGCRQDAAIMELLKKYGLSCATFFLNTGLNADGVNGFSLDEVASGVYDGFDVECHSLTHGILPDIQNDLDAIKREIVQDVENVASAVGIQPVGMAWPYGQYNEKIAKRIMANSSIRFGRVVVGTKDFSLPVGFMQWQPSCGISDDILMQMAEDFVKADCTEDMLFYVWGHGYELDQYDLYDELETLIKMIAEADDIVPVTNAEFYQLFKDEIPNWAHIR